MCVAVCCIVAVCCSECIVLGPSCRVRDRLVLAASGSCVCVAVCGSVLYCAAVSVLFLGHHVGFVIDLHWQHLDRVCVLPCVAVCCRVLQCVIVCRSECIVLGPSCRVRDKIALAASGSCVCVAVCCSVL